MAEKIARLLAGLDVHRFDLRYSAGRLPHAALLRSIELFGAEVVPRVRKLLAGDRVSVRYPPRSPLHRTLAGPE